MTDQTVQAYLTPDEWRHIQRRRERQTWNEGYNRAIWEAFNVVDRHDLRDDEERRKVVKILESLIKKEPE